MDCSIIILSFNTKDLTVNAIRSVFSSKTGYHYEIIVVDNASADNSVQFIRNEFPQVQLIENKMNVGFAKANNQGMKIAKGKYVLLLNSDTIVEPDTLDVMIRFMNEHPRIGASGCKIVLPDGSLDKACKRGFPTPSASFYYVFGLSRMFPNNPKLNQYQLGHLDPDRDYPVDCLVGAFMMVRREAIDRVGLLDEDFFMYGEDIDWCYRIKQSGWEIYYYPYVRITHYKGASSRKKPFKIIYEFHRAMVLFHRKHYQKQYSWLINVLVYAGISVKFTLSLLLNRFGSVR
jgi:GT2 family glycosyltransferase